MRLSTLPDRDPDHGISVIHAALDARVSLLDTADAYCLNDQDTGHNERLIAEALRTWSGDAATIEVATKGGLIRPDGAWVPHGRALHLTKAKT
jgi:aryl-alcohol dehydrogenase-like predicted oxidoreductase